MHHPTSLTPPPTHYPPVPPLRAPMLLDPTCQGYNADVSSTALSTILATIPPGEGDPEQGAPWTICHECGANPGKHKRKGMPKSFAIVETAGCASRLCLPLSVL